MTGGEESRDRFTASSARSRAGAEADRKLSPLALGKKEGVEIDKTVARLALGRTESEKAPDGFVHSAARWRAGAEVDQRLA